MSDPQPVEQLTYEEARAELIATVRTLETGQAPLEESMTLWERGEELAKRCQQILDDASARIEAALPATEGTEEAG